MYFIRRHTHFIVKHKKKKKKKNARPTDNMLMKKSKTIENRFDDNMYRYIIPSEWIYLIYIHIECNALY